MTVSRHDVCRPIPGKFTGRDLFANLSTADGDSDFVPDACDECPNTPSGVPVESDGCPPPIPGDFDRNGSVDFADLAHLEECRTGQGVPIINPNCLVTDIANGDGFNGQSDFGIWQACFRGASVLADPGCAD